MKKCCLDLTVVMFEFINLLKICQTLFKVLIRINAGKVLLAYTRMKKLFSAFNFNVGEYYTDSAMMLAQSYGKEFGLKSEDFQKHVFENVGERLKKIEKDMPSTSGN